MLLRDDAIGERRRINGKKPAMFMTNGPCVGEALSLQCQGHRRRVELTGGGRTRISEVYPDRLCKDYDILDGLVNQMQVDGRMGSTFNTCGPDMNWCEQIEELITNEISCGSGEGYGGQALTWSRKDYGASRLTFSRKPRTTMECVRAQSHPRLGHRPDP